MAVITKSVRPPVTAAQAIANFKANGAISPQSIVDTSANLVAALDQLRPLAAANGIAAVAFTDTQPLTIGYMSYVANAAVLAVFPPVYSLILTAVTAAGAAAVQAAAHVTSFTVADTASAIAANLVALAGASNLTTIGLTSGNVLTVLFPQLTAAAGALNKITTAFRLTVTGVAVANLTQAHGYAHVGAIVVADTAAAVTSAFAVLNADTLVSAIGVTDSAPLTLSYAVYAANSAMVRKLIAGTGLTVTGVTVANAAAVQAGLPTGTFNLSDSSANIAAALDTLNSASRLGAIALTDPAAIVLTNARFQADATAIGKLTGNATVTVTGAGVADAPSLQASARVGSFTIVDTAAKIAGSLDGLNRLGKLASITLSDTAIPRITYAQLTNDGFALGKLPANYLLTVLLVPAAGAVSVQASSHVRSFSITDSATAIATNIDTLGGLGKLTDITLTTPEPMAFTASQFAAAGAVLSKIVSNFAVSVRAAPAASTVSLQTAPHVVAFSVTDTAANVLANLAGLSGANRLVTITVTDTAALTITSAQLTAGAMALAKLAAGTNFVVNAVTVSAASAMQANARVLRFSITDTAAAVAAGLDLLNTMGKLTAISLSDSAPLVISAALFAADTTALGKLPAGATLAVSGVSAAAAAAFQGNARVVSFNVNDTAANVTGNLAALTAATKLQTITLTDTSALTLTQDQVAAAQTLLNKLPPAYALIVTGVSAAGAGAAQTSGHVRSFSVTDYTANVAANLDALNGDGKLTRIVLNDTQMLALSFTQYGNDAAALGKIVSGWSATVSGAGAAYAAALQGNTAIRSFSVSDNALSVAANIDTLNGESKLSAITITSGGALALTARQIAANTSALGKITSTWQLTAVNAAIGDLGALHANGHVTGIQITDTAANIGAALATLNTDSLVKLITVSGGNTLGVTYAQFTASGVALSKLATTTLLTVSGVAAANAQGMQANGRVTSFSVTDTAANIVVNLDALALDGKLSSAVITGSAALSLGYGKYAADGAVLNKIAGTWSMTVTNATAAAAAGVAANAHVTQFTVSDQLAAIGLRLDQLEAAAKSGKLTSIMVTDNGASLTLTQAQAAADTHALALLHGNYTIIQPPSAGHATINLVWDAQALAAPASFRSAVTYAAEYIQTLITNPITLNLAVGYGEVSGSSLGQGVLGAAGPDQGLGRSYADFKTDLSGASMATQAIANALSATDPSNGGLIYVASAEAKALGLMSGTDTSIDGSMGFAADPAGTLFTYDPANRGVSGKYDLIGVVEHEITHALGRIAIAGTYGNYISALDVFRYIAPNIHGATAVNAYFSVNNGVTNLDTFSPTSDLGDWASSAGNDANNAYSHSGVVNQFSQSDIIQLEALGFATSGTPSARTVGTTPVSAGNGLNAPALSFTGTPTLAFFSDDLTVLEVSLSPPAGIEEIAWFKYGTDQLRIDLRGAAPSQLTAFDTMVEGQHAIALANAADTSHGLILTNMAAAETAADLMAHHVTFASGQAIIG